MAVAEMNMSGRVLQRKPRPCAARPLQLEVDKELQCIYTPIHERVRELAGFVNSGAVVGERRIY
ncbi:MAG: hypothetical protein ACRC3G_02170 [Bacteroidales bacterium]